MTRKIFMVLVLGIIIGMAPVAVLANPGTLADLGFGSSGMSSSDKGSSDISSSDSVSAQKSAESVDTVDADMWPASGPVETGAVPGDPNNDKLSPLDTHFNPQHPDLRTIDLGGGGE